MPEPSHAESFSPMAQALGRIPSGLYILSVVEGPRSTGILVSWVQQAGFEPPTLTVAVNRSRYVADWIAEVGSFALNQVAAGQKKLLRHFAQGFPRDAPAFAGLSLLEGVGDRAILADALSYMICRVEGHLDTGDHRIFLARVEGGAMIHPDGEPMLHVRRNGLHY